MLEKKSEVFLNAASATVRLSCGIGAVRAYSWPTNAPSVRTCARARLRSWRGAHGSRANSDDDRAAACCDE